MLGGVPISVVMPPRSDPKARGMRNSDGDRSWRLARRIATGSRRARAPTFFMKAEQIVTRPVSAVTCRVFPEPSRDSRSERTPARPELARPRLTTSTAATGTTAGLPNPENARPAGIIPAAVRTSSAARATRS